MNETARSYGGDRFLRRQLMKSRACRRRLVSMPSVAVLGLLSYLLFSVAFGSSERVGPSPTLVYPAVPLDGANSVEKIRWSPSGDLILIEAAALSGSTEPRHRLVVVLDLATRSVAARVPGARLASWGPEDSLWVWTAEDWEVYAPPFRSATVWESGYGAFAKHDYGTDSWDLSTASGRLAVATGTEAPIDEYPAGGDDWNITVFEHGKESFAVQITPEYANGSMRKPSLTFSPSGRLLAVVISGWLGYESPGREELWLVDVEERRVAHVHNGKNRWWQLADGDIQSLDPSWSLAEDAVVYGDYFFGIEELSIPGAESRSVIGKRSEVADVLISPTGRWIAFDRWPDEKEEEDQYDRCLGAVSRDGRRTLHLPKEFINWPYMYKAWHPKKDVLAVLRRNPGHQTHDLLFWDLGE